MVYSFAFIINEQYKYKTKRPPLSERNGEVFVFVSQNLSESEITNSLSAENLLYARFRYRCHYRLQEGHGRQRTYGNGL